MEHQNNKGFISSLKPKAAFRLGIVYSVIVVFIIAFFILLGMFIKKDNNSLTGNTDNNKNNVKQEIIKGDSGIEIETINNNDWIRGDKKAAISIVEFSDIDCPFCKRFHDTMNQVVSAYDGQVNWIYRHFPLTSLHPDASKKAEATECVGEIGGNDKFWQYLDKVFAESTSVDNLAVAAANLGIDQDDFQECLDSGRHADKIRSHSSQAQAAGGRGTPYSIIIVDDQTIPINGALPFEQVKSLIDQVL